MWNGAVDELARESMMKSPFPGMDPFLEQKGVWSEVHTDLIVGIRQFLTPLLRPKYRVAMEQRNYLAVAPPNDSIGEPDLIVSIDDPSALQSLAPIMTATAEPMVGKLPMTENIRERYLEIRVVETKEVVTVIEILSPTNKRAVDGRAQYEKKRAEVLGSWTNLIEIDLLRAGRPMPIGVDGTNHYRLVVSRKDERPKADIYLFSVRDLIPTIPVPLMPDDKEPHLDLNQILHEIYDRSAYDMAVKYNRTPPPSEFSEEDLAWVQNTAQSFVKSNEINGNSEV